MIKKYIYGGAAVEQAERPQVHRAHWLWLLLEGLLLLGIGAVAEADRTLLVYMCGGDL